MTTDHYPQHVKRVDQLIASGEASRKVAKEIAEDQKVRQQRDNAHMCTLYSMCLYIIGIYTCACIYTCVLCVYIRTSVSLFHYASDVVTSTYRLYLHVHVHV